MPKWQQVSHANNQPWWELAFLQSPSRFIIDSKRYSSPMYCHFGLWDRCPTWNIRFCVARILYTDFCDLSMQMRKISFFTFFMNFHFFQWKFTLCVKIHFWGENSVERYGDLIFVKMHNFGLGYLSHWYKKRRKWKMQEKIWVCYWQNAVFDI